MDGTGNICSPRHQHQLQPNILMHGLHTNVATSPVCNACVSISPTQPCMQVKSAAKKSLLSSHRLLLLADGLHFDTASLQLVGLPCIVCTHRMNSSTVWHPAASPGGGHDVARVCQSRI